MNYQHLVRYYIILACEKYNLTQTLCILLLHKVKQLVYFNQQRHNNSARVDHIMLQNKHKKEQKLMIIYYLLTFRSQLTIIDIE